MEIISQIEKLKEEIRRCNKCNLAETRVNALCGEGNLNAELMLIAQAPGEKEDKEGKMFIGPSGKVLDELLRTVHINRKEIYMTNLIKCMLPKYRKPKREEIEICSQYLDREIELISPDILASLGYYATRYIFEKYYFPLPTRQEFKEVCGKAFETEGKKIIPVQHPAALLHNSAIKEDVLRNYRKMKALLSSPLE